MAKVTVFTAVAKKLVMAFTGLLLCAFLVAHLAGNLQLFWNTSQFNAYAHLLTVSEAPLVTLFELCLLAIFCIHILDAIVLLKGNYEARPQGYYKKGLARSKSNKTRKSASSTFMMWSGTLILVFVVFHLWHFKYKHGVYPDSGPVSSGPAPAVGVVNGGIAATGSGSAEETYDLAKLVYDEFQHPLVTLIYLAAMTVLAMHLYHAVSSALTTVGANTPRFTKPIIWLGRIFTLVICGGFALIPLLIQIHVLKLPPPPSEPQANAALMQPASP
jgi:succinate dehydrogenase / fumarate reductase cytochrome b subunit